MVTQLIEWLMNLLREFAKFGQWLVTPLPYLDIAPLALFSFAGLTALVVILLVRLVVGG